MKKLKAQLTRASKSLSEGRSLWVIDGNYAQKETLQAINAASGKDHKVSENFGLLVKIGNTPYIFNGHCNKSRGDFYINLKEWKLRCAIEFPVGSSLNCEIVGIFS